MCIAVILAAGQSTRLRDITGDIPKPLVEIKGKSIIEYNIENLHKQGFNEIIITTHYKSNMIHDRLGNGKKYGVRIEYSNEDELLNTAGSLLPLKERLNEDFLVCGGSFLVPNFQLNRLLETHKLNGNLATILLSRCLDSNLLKYYGQAIVNNGKIIKFEEKPKVSISNYIHTTYQIFSPQILNKYEGKKSIPDLLKFLISKGEKIGGYVTDNQLINISSEELYYKAISNPFF